MAGSWAVVALLFFGSKPPAWVILFGVHQFLFGTGPLFDGLVHQLKDRVPNLDLIRRTSLIISGDTSLMIFTPRSS